MIHDPLQPPADAASPDANRAGPDASARLPEWAVRFIAVLVHFILENALAAALRRAARPALWNYRSDLPSGSVQQFFAWKRRAFGHTIARMCLRHGIGPDHPDWPYLSRTIVAFGGSIEGFRPGLPALGLKWWENPSVVPGLCAQATPSPAAAAIAALLAQQDTMPLAHDAPVSAAPALSIDAGMIQPPIIRRPVFARPGKAPPTGPPTGLPRWPRLGQPIRPPPRPPPVWGFPFLSCLTNGAAPRLVPPS